MAQNMAYQQEENLASKMEQGAVKNVNDIKAILASRNADVNAPNGHGFTPLMIACGKGEKDMVVYLLKHGANPNARCARDRNTPMHYASLNSDCKCLHRREPCHYERPDTFTAGARKDIIGLLLSHGATLMYNSNGLNPPSLAALHKCWEIVEFFVEMDVPNFQMSHEERVKLYEMLGMAMAISMYPFSLDKGTYDYFFKAATLREENGIGLEQDYEMSDIAASFTLFKEGHPCRSLDDWKYLYCDTTALRIQAFLIADRLVPQEMKTKYILNSLLIFACCSIVSCSMGRINAAQCHGLQILRELLPFELQLKLPPGRILGSIFCVFETGEHQCDVSYLTKCIELMRQCLYVLEDVSEQHLLEASKQLLMQLGKIWFVWGLYGGCRTQEIFDSLLDFSEQMIGLFWRHCGPVFSIAHYFLDEIGKNICVCDNCSEGGMRLKTIQYLMKRLISRLIPYEDTSQVNDKGNTMLHSLAEVEEHLEPSFCQDVAVILIRNGCRIDALNSEGETAGQMIQLYSEHDSDAKKLLQCISPQTAVLSLEELATRTILRHKIPHEGVLPKQVSAIVRGQLDPDELLFPPPEEYTFFNSYSDSLGGLRCEFDDEYDPEFENGFHPEFDDESDDVEGDPDDFNGESDED